MYSSNFPRILAGFPAATVFSEISLVTMDPAPIIELDPTDTLGRIMAESPMKQFSPITILSILVKPRSFLVVTKPSTSGGGPGEVLPIQGKMK